LLGLAVLVCTVFALAPRSEASFRGFSLPNQTFKAPLRRGFVIRAVRVIAAGERDIVVAVVAKSEPIIAGCRRAERRSLPRRALHRAHAVQSAKRRAHENPFTFAS
jgi:hypothetical protein